jgi:hypothetical protein
MIGLAAMVWCDRTSWVLPSESITKAPLSRAMSTPTAMSHCMLDMMMHPSVRPSVAQARSSAAEALHGFLDFKVEFGDEVSVAFAVDRT